jgi:hypothetical protein
MFKSQAAFEKMKWPVPKLEMCTCENGVTMGEGAGWKQGTITVEHLHWCSFFSDYCALFLYSKADLEIASSYLFNHLLKLRLQINIGTRATPSKTQAALL